jgi:hypothetical protein
MSSPMPRPTRRLPHSILIVRPPIDLLAAEGLRSQRDATLRMRGDQLRQLARCLGYPPEDVTAAMLVDWFGQQRWSPECRRSYRSAIRGFFSWAYKMGRVPVYLGDVLPRLPQLKAAPRPAPDDAWAAACAAADARTVLMLRLAAEAGLRSRPSEHPRRVHFPGRRTIGGARQRRQATNSADQRPTRRDHPPGRDRTHTRNVLPWLAFPRRFGWPPQSAMGRHARSTGAARGLHQDSSVPMDVLSSLGLNWIPSR